MMIKKFLKEFFYLHFAIIIVMFIIVSLIGNKHYTLEHYLLTFTGFKSVGNSNWYMFVTFSLYILVFIAFMLFRKSKVLGVGALFALVVAFVYIEKEILNLSILFYDTIFCFPLGMLFSLIKPYVDKIVMKNDIICIVHGVGSGIIKNEVHSTLKKNSIFIYTPLKSSSPLMSS